MHAYPVTNCSWAAAPSRAALLPNGHRAGKHCSGTITQGGSVAGKYTCRVSYSRRGKHACKVAKYYFFLLDQGGPEPRLADA
jgi:hypothetical protein